MAYYKSGLSSALDLRFVNDSAYPSSGGTITCTTDSSFNAEDSCYRVGSNIIYIKANYLTFTGSTSNYNTSMTIYNPNHFAVVAFYSSSKGTSGSWSTSSGSKTTSSVTINAYSSVTVTAYDVSGYNDTECGVYYGRNGHRFQTYSTVGTSKTGAVGSNLYLHYSV